MIQTKFLDFSTKINLVIRKICLILVWELNNIYRYYLPFESIYLHMYKILMYFNHYFCHFTPCVFLFLTWLQGSLKQILTISFNNYLVLI